MPSLCEHCDNAGCPVSPRGRRDCLSCVEFRPRDAAHAEAAELLCAQAWSDVPSHDYELSMAAFRSLCQVIEAAREVA